MSSITLRPVRPYRFDLILHHWGHNPHEILDVVKNGAFHRVIELESTPVLYRLINSGTNQKPQLSLRFLNGRLSRTQLEKATRIVSRTFSLHVDLKKFYRAVAGDEVLSRIGKTFRGLKPKLIGSTLFENLAIAIMGQQVNLTFATTLKRRLVEAFGPRVVYRGKIFYGFPAAGRLATVDPEKLRKMQFSRQKSRYILDLARQVASGEIDLESYRYLEPDRAVEQLMAIRGIGRWTAEYCLMRGIGYLDALPAGDTGLQNAVTRFYRFKKRATEDQVRKLGERWKPYRSLATFYLWYALSKRLPLIPKS